MGTSKKWWDDVSNLVIPQVRFGTKVRKKAATATKKRSSADRAMISSARRSGSGTVAKKSGKMAKRGSGFTAKKRPRRKK